MKKINFKWLLLSFILSIASSPLVWAKTIYYNDNGQSGTPKVYFWGGTSPTTTWDGSPSMTNVTGNIYKYDVGDNTKVIFRYNNASSQTGDLTVPTGEENYMPTYNANSSTSWSKYAPKPAICGSMNDWSPTENQFSGTSGSVTCSISLSANTVYEFKVLTGTNWNGYGSSDGELTYLGQSGGTALGNNSGNNIRIATAGAGTYTFTYATSTRTLSVAYPSVTHPSSDYVYYKNTKSWTNVYAYIYGGTTNVWAGTKMSSFNFDGTDYYYAALGDNTSVVFNQGNGTNQDDCKSITGNKGKYYDPSSTSWKPFTATLSLDHQGPTNTPAPNSITVTYGANTNLTGDVITTSPAKTGYTFGGYYTSAGGGGSQLIGTNENVVASISNYTDASKNWIRTGSSVSSTIYAKWTQSVTLDEQGATTSGTTSKSVTYNSNAGLTTMITAPSKTGYDYGGYYTDVAGGGYQIINNRTWQASISGYTDASKKWIKPSGATTIYAYWSQSVTLNANTSYHGSGSNKTATAVWNGTALSSFTATAGDTGYEVEGYYTNATSGTKVLNADGTFAADNVTSYITSGKWTKAGATTLYAHMRAKTYTVTLDKNEGDTDGSVKTTYNANTTSNFNAAGRAGYTCDGYFTASEDGTKVINSDGTLVDASVTNWLSSGYWVKDGADITLYAQWTENLANYTVTYGVKAAQSSLGSLSCATTTGSTPVSSGGTVVGGTNVTFTASPISGYEVDAWYSDAACSKRIAAAGYYTSTFAPTVNSDTTVYVTFKKKVYTITYSPSSAPTGCTYTTKPTSATYGNTVTMVITPTAGYSVSVSARDASSNVVSISNPSANTYTFTQPASAVTVTVTATELKKTLTPTVDYNGGATPATPYTATSANNLGVVTTSVLTASAPTATEYTFAGWTLTNLTVTSGDPASDRSITVKITDYSQAISAVANYNEVLTTSYELRGGSAFGTHPTNPWDNVHALTKKSGHSTESVAYYTASIASTNTGSANGDFQFKIKNGDTWYGIEDSGDQWWYTRAISAGDSKTQTLSSSGKNIELRADIAGDYEIKVDYSSTPTITITFPTTYTLTYAIGSVAGTSGTISTSPSTASGSLVLSGTNITLTGPAAKSGYTWKGWYTNAAGTEGKIDDVSRAITVTMDADKTLYACYTEDMHTVTIDKGDNSDQGSLNVTSATAGIATASSTITATPSAGYYFSGWTGDIGDGVTIVSGSTTSASITIRATADDKTITANFQPIWTIAGLGGDWDANKLTLYTTYKESTVNYALLDIDTLKPNTDYQFKAVQRSTGDYVWWTAEVAEERNINYGNSNTRLDMVSGGMGNNLNMRTAGAGRYTFDINLDDEKHPIKVHYPTSYTVTFGYGTGGSAVTATVEDATAITTGQYAAEGKDITFTQTPATGYTFKGWYNAESGGTAISCMSTSDHVYDNIAGNIAVYAQYTANTYAVTFNATTNGGTLSGSSPKNVTFDATSIASCPTANKAGYCFDGWYTAATSGKKVINPDGSFVANVTDWTDEDGKWKVAEEATVYAVYVKPEIIMTQDGKGLISSMPGYDTLIVNQSFGCTPAADYNISYTVGYKVSHTQLAPQPKINYCAAAVAGVRHDTIIMPVADGANSYEVVAYLKTGTTRGSGTDVTTDTLNVDVETSYAVKVRAVVDGVDIADERLALLYPSFAAISVTIWKEIDGYELDSIDLGVGVTVKDTTERPDCYWIRYYAANASTITAVYKPKANTVYLFNATNKACMYAASRTKLYDYTTYGYWGYGDHTGDGAGSTGKTGDTVKTVTGFDNPVWMASIGEGSTHFAFTSDKLNNVSFFGSYTSPNTTVLPAHVIYRTDYNAILPMFVPVVKDNEDCYILNKHDGTGQAQYYRGFWVKRSPDLDSTGYYLKVYNKQKRSDEPYAGTRDPELIQSVPLRLTQTGANDTWELTATIDLEANKTYGFKFTKATGANSVVWYADTNEGIITSSAHTGWDNFVTDLKENTGITTTAAGDYTFHIYCTDYGTIAANTATAAQVQGKFAVTVDYAAESGDYRVIYSDATQTEVISSPSIRPRANGQDTVSFFIRKSSASRVMKIQKFDSDWEDVSDVDLSTIAKDSVYVIYLQQNEDADAISVTGIDFYDGDYYIRTDCVDEYKWDYKKSLENHRMIPTDYGMTAKQPDKFSHYYVHWLTGNSNVKFIVANKYAPCLSDTVITDDWVTDTGGNLGEKGANIRFMYNKGTNKAMRAYLYGSQENDDDYLKLTKTSGSMTDRTSAVDEITFTDLGNFTYQAEIAAQPGLRGKLTAKYLSTTQYFLGSEDSDEELIGGTDGDFQNILLTYDFKSNRLICAWQPSGATITEDLDINADILIIRKAQGDAQQIRFSGKTKIDDVHYIYGVIEFEYRDMYHMLYTWDWWSYSHCMYYISFPFDVLVNDIAGVGTLGVDWRIQRYNGAKRAEKGWFEDGEKTFWEDIHAGDTLHAYEGYSLLLNRSRFNGTAGNIWENKTYGDKVYLYFPSVSPLVGELSNQSVTVHVPAHQCTKDQTFTNSYGMLVNHKVTDSHWNMIGTPMFADTTASSIATGPDVETGYGSETLQYVYAWSYYGNTLGIKLTLDEDWRFKTMYSYMAQYAGDIVFQGPAINKVVAAKRNEEKKNYHVKLEISKDDMFIGRTYIELRENAVDSFLLNEDICMFRNGVNADLFTYAGGYEAGANVLPIANQVVPVGIAVKQAGTYVFSMPANFDGEVILVDKYAQTRTNLMLEDYEVALPTGEITDRFEVEININKVATAIDGTSGDGSLKDGNAHKFIENGMMYILQNGALYDAQGKRVK